MLFQMQIQFPMFSFNMILEKMFRLILFKNQIYPVPDESSESGWGDGDYSVEKCAQFCCKVGSGYAFFFQAFFKVGERSLKCDLRKLTLLMR
jgi:hypothetical protein